MSALPSPPTNEWATEVTEILEDVLQRLTKVEDICENLLEQNEQWVAIRSANEAISRLRDRMLVTPILSTKRPRLDSDKNDVDSENTLVEQ